MATSLSTDFPSAVETFEYLALSSILYNTKDLDEQSSLPDDLQLHLVVNYDGNPICDRTIVVSSPSKKYVAAVFRGVVSRCLASHGFVRMRIISLSNHTAAR